MKKSIAVGEENFKNIIDNNCFFVDKSLLIKDIIEDNSRVKLITRPRRFGKTLNQSMLKYFFEISDSDTSYLFNGLAVSKYSDIMKHQGKYPVIYLSLKEVYGLTFSRAFDEFKKIVQNEFIRNKFLLSLNLLEDRDTSIIESILQGYNKTDLSDISLYSSAIAQLIYYLHISTGMKPVILIDEYDVPLQYSYQYKYYDDMLLLIRSVFGSLLKTNDNFYRAVLTGCLRISKESIFTGLNNFVVYDILSDTMSEYYGFTEEEIHNILNYFDITASFVDIKDWYDGYVFGHKEIYNPFSVIQCIKYLLENDSTAFSNYWINSSGNAILNNLLSYANRKEVKNDFKDLINGESIIASINTSMTYADMDDIENVWSVLLYTGYLKQINYYGNGIYDLKIPNKEVLSSFIKLYNNFFERDLRKRSYDSLMQSFIGCDVDSICLELNKIFRHFMSFYDCNESFYHGYMSCIVNQSDDFELLSNREAGFGRFDLCLYDRFRSVGFIIEIKSTHNRKELKQKAADALQQIIDNNYSEALEYYDIKTIHLYGISFFKNECYVVGN